MHVCQAALEMGSPRHALVLGKEKLTHESDCILYRVVRDNSFPK